MINNFSNITANKKGVKDMKKNAKKKKGFTLIELIAVIAILGILAAVVVPKVGSYTATAKLNAKKADASTMLNAIEAYNAQADSAKNVDTSGSDTTVTIADIAAGKYSHAQSGNDLDTAGAQDLKTIASRIVSKNSTDIPGTTTVANLVSIINSTN